MINAASILSRYSEPLDWNQNSDWPARWRLACVAKLPVDRQRVDPVDQMFLAASLLSAVPSRQYEFLVGRLLAEILLADSGCTPSERLSVGRSDRSPIWPRGFTGSIAHNAQCVAAVVGQQEAQHDSIGIDIEQLDQSAEALDALRLCFDEQETSRLSRHEHGLVIGFSVKESLFKCLYPLCGQMFDFLDAELIEWDLAARHARLQLKVDLGPELRAGSRFEAHWQIQQGQVLSRVLSQGRLDSI